MNFGLQISNLEWVRLRDLAQAAEGMGFHSLMLPDHIVAEGPEKQANLQHLSYDPIIQAAVIAEATTKLHVGHLVLCNLFRHPVFTAQSISTLDHLSGGRVFLGLGSGWTETEFKMTGINFPPIADRLRMLDEALTCIRGLWTAERTTFDGEFYHLQDAILWPKPFQKPQPPIVLGGSGKGLLRIAARHADIVNIISDVGKAGYIAITNTRKFTDQAFREKVQFVRAEAVQNGREAKSVRISHVIFQTMLTDSPAATRAIAENFGNIFRSTPEEALRSPLFLIGTPEECVAELKRRTRDWDLAEIVFSGLDDANLKRVATEIVPHV